MSNSASKFGKYYYVLAQSWPRSLKYHRTTIAKNDKLNPINHWILHGLYVNWTHGHLTEETYEDSPVYETPENIDTLHNLDKLLPSAIESTTNADRFQNMYNKHGKAFIHYQKLLFDDENKGIRTPEAYLCKAANLTIEYNMGKYLRRFNVGGSHEIEKIRDWVKRKIREETQLITFPYIKYITDYATGINYLSEVHLYFDTNFKLKPEEMKPMIFKRHAADGKPYQIKATYSQCVHDLPVGHKCENENCNIIAATHPIPGTKIAEYKPKPKKEEPKKEEPKEEEPKEEEPKEN